MTIIHKINILSLAKIYSLLMAIMGFIVGLLFSLLRIMAPSLYTNSSLGMPALAYSSLGLMSLIFFPVIYGIMGFIIGALTAVLYNFVAKFVGGLEIEINKK